MLDVIAASFYLIRSPELHNSRIPILKSQNINVFRDYSEHLRSSHQRCLVEKSVLKNFTIFESFFNKVPSLHVCNFLKKRLQHKCFPVTIAKFLGAPILKNIWEQLLLALWPPTNFKSNIKFLSNFSSTKGTQRTKSF